MQLTKNQIVVFDDGHKEGYLEARWSERAQAFISFTDDGEKMYSTDVREKPQRKRAKFVPSASNCTREIYPIGQTDKAYQVEDGSNGKVGRGCKVYYKYIAKSICFTDAAGNIYAPVWA